MQNKLTRAIANLSQDSQVFNKIAEKHDNYSFEAIQKQYKIIESEFQEMSEGVFNNDVEEVLDSCADVIVTVVGLMQQLEAAGIDVSEACSRIADNNLSKYVKDKREVDLSVNFYKQKGVDVKVSYNPEYNVYMLTDSQGKIRKPSSFKDVYIQDLIPNDLLLKGFPSVQ